MIPKIIHYFWENKNFSDSLPDSITENIKSWLHFCPDYKFMFWNKSNLPIKDNKFLQQAYANKDFGYAVDFVKPYVLNKYGGIYMDTDIELLKPFDDEILSKPCFFAWEHENYKPKFLGTAIIGAEKGNKLIKYILSYYNQANYMEDDKVVTVPSNYALMDIINGLKNQDAISDDDYHIFEQKYFYPIDLFYDAYTKHKCHASWVQNVSIILPTENNITAVKRTIESLLNQVSCCHYEIIAVDNHSTDGTAELLRYYYEHSDIKLIEMQDIENTYADCIEIGLKRAVGRYSIICNPEHPLNDITVHNVNRYKCISPITILSNTNDSASLDLIQKTDIGFGNIIFEEQFRKKFLEKKQWFNSYFSKSEVTKAFVLKAFVDNIPIDFIKGKPFSEVNEIGLLNCLFNKQYSKELTACICFRNEGDEVENTIRSIKYISNDINILLVDDCSTDDYDYKHIAEVYDCLYHKTDKQVGSVGAKDWAARNCPTEYFILFDGHMRIFNYKLLCIMLDQIKKDPNQILSPRTIYMGKKNGRLTNEDLIFKVKKLTSYNCSVTFDKEYIFDPKWTDKQIKDNSCACVLGACYCTSKTWWKYIDGFNGLINYGLEESFISIKTWLLGGKCTTIPDYGTGHLYRNVNINNSDPNLIDANRLSMAYLFLDDITEIQIAIASRIGQKNYNEAFNAFVKNKPNLDKIKSYINEHKVHNLTWFKEHINNKVI